MTRRAAPSRGAQALRRTHRPAVPAVKPPAGRFDAFSYSNAAGTRSYRAVDTSGNAGPTATVVAVIPAAITPKKRSATARLVSAS